MPENLYILNGKIAVRASSLQEWSRAFETLNRQVALTVVDEVSISTVFLGIDYNFFGIGDPLLFETMVSDRDGIRSIGRYFTWDEAEAGHEELVTAIREQQSLAGQNASEAIAKLLADSSSPE